MNYNKSIKIVKDLRNEKRKKQKKKLKYLKPFKPQQYIFYKPYKQSNNIRNDYNNIVFIEPRTIERAQFYQQVSHYTGSIMDNHDWSSLQGLKEIKIDPMKLIEDVRKSLKSAKDLLPIDKMDTLVNYMYDQLSNIYEYVKPFYQIDFEEIKVDNLKNIQEKMKNERKRINQEWKEKRKKQKEERQKRIKKDKEKRKKLKEQFRKKQNETKIEQPGEPGDDDDLDLDDDDFDEPDEPGDDDDLDLDDDDFDDPEDRDDGDMDDLLPDEPDEPGDDDDLDFDDDDFDDPEDYMDDWFDFNPFDFNQNVNPVDVLIVIKELFQKIVLKGLKDILKTVFKAFDKMIIIFIQIFTSAFKKCLEFFKRLIPLILEQGENLVNSRYIVSFLLFYYLPRFFEETILYNPTDIQDISNLLYAQPITPSYLRYIIGYPIRDVNRAVSFYRLLLKYYVSSLFKTICPHFLKLIRDRLMSKKKSNSIINFVIKLKVNRRKIEDVIGRNWRKKYKQRIKREETSDKLDDEIGDLYKKRQNYYKLQDKQKRILQDLRNLNLIKLINRHYVELDNVEKNINIIPYHLRGRNRNPINPINNNIVENIDVDYKDNLARQQSLQIEEEMLANDLIEIEKELTLKAKQQLLKRKEKEYFESTVPEPNPDLPLPPMRISNNNKPKDINIIPEELRGPLPLTFDNVDLNQFITDHEIGRVFENINTEYQVPLLDIDEILGSTVDTFEYDDVPDLPELEKMGFDPEFIQHNQIQQQTISLIKLIKVFFWQVWMKELEEEYRKALSRLLMINVEPEVIEQPEQYFKKHYAIIIKLLLKGNQKWKTVLKIMKVYYKQFHTIEKHEFLEKYKPFKDLIKKIDTDTKNLSNLNLKEKNKLIKNHLIYKKWRSYNVKKILIHLRKFLKKFIKFMNHINEREFNDDLFELFIKNYFDYLKYPSLVLKRLHIKYTSLKKFHVKEFHKVFKAIFKINENMVQFIQNNYWTLYNFYKMFVKKIESINKFEVKYIQDIQFATEIITFRDRWLEYVKFLLFDLGFPIYYQKYKKKFPFKMLEYFLKNYDKDNEEIALDYIKHIDKLVEFYESNISKKKRQQMIELKKKLNQFPFKHSFTGFAKKIFENPKIQKRIKKIINVSGLFSRNIIKGLKLIFKYYLKFGTAINIFKRRSMWSHEDLIDRILLDMDHFIDAYRRFINVLKVENVISSKVNPFSVFIDMVIKYSQNNPNKDPNNAYSITYRYVIIDEYKKNVKINKKK